MPVKLPPVIVQLLEATVRPAPGVKTPPVHASVVQKPEPVTEKVVPTGPEVGVKVIVGLSMVSEVNAVSVPGLGVAVMVSGTGATFPITNEPDRIPPESEQTADVTEPTTDPVSVQVVSPVEKPEPDT